MAHELKVPIEKVADEGKTPNQQVAAGGSGSMREVLLTGTHVKIFSSAVEMV